MLQVYLDPCTVNSHKVTAALNLLGTEHQFNHVDYFKGEQKGEAYLKINPFATVPSAVDGDLHITESNAILQYIADLNGGSDLYPKDLKARTNVNRWLLWETSSWFPSCYIYLVEYVVKPLLKAEPDQAAIDAESPRFHRYAAILNAELGKHKFLVGDHLTIADIAVAAPMHLWSACRLPLDEYPHLKKWMCESMETLPCWAKTQPAVTKALLPHLESANGAANGANGASSGKEVRANFNYTKDVDQLTELYFYETDKAKGIHEPGDDPHEMAITDGWDRVDSFTLDKSGFSVHDWAAQYDKWDDEDSVAKEFYPEVVEFVKKTAGAKRVVVFDHTIRTESNAAKKITEEKGTSQRAPVMLVHCDYTHDSGPLRVRQLLPDEAEDLLSRRVAFLNVWKPIRRVVEDRPLAMCEVPSTDPQKDFIKLHLHYRDRDGENYVMRHSPSHKWWYFPKIDPAKAIILKTYESETDGRARFVGHSAFIDPRQGPDTPYRESIEIRTMAFF